MIKIVPKQINETIPGIVLCSHGSLSEGMLSAVQMIYGECPNMAAIGLEVSDNVAEWGKELGVLTKLFPGGTIILIDLYGGTPCSQCLLQTVKELKCGRPICAIAGLNLGMVLELLVLREQVEIDQITAVALEAGKKAVVDCFEHFKERKTE